MGGAYDEGSHLAVDESPDERAEEDVERLELREGQIAHARAAAAQVPYYVHEGAGEQVGAAAEQDPAQNEQLGLGHGALDGVRRRVPPRAQDAHDSNQAEGGPVVLEGRKLLACGVPVDRHVDIGGQFPQRLRRRRIGQREELGPRLLENADPSPAVDPGAEGQLQTVTSVAESVNEFLTVRRATLVSRV